MSEYKTQLNTGDEIEIDFSRGGYQAGIKINGSDRNIIKGAELNIHAGEPTVLTVHFGLRSLKPQRGYFVSEKDMREYVEWKLTKRLSKEGEA